jgi:hypothetical protein
VAGDGQHASDGCSVVDGGCLEHAPQAIDVVHVGIESAAGLNVDATDTEAFDERQQRRVSVR